MMKLLFNAIACLKSSNSNLAKFIRYGLIGGSAALLDFSVFFLLFKTLPLVLASSTILSFSSIEMANTAGILAGFLWGFFMQKKWAFQAEGHIQSQFIYTVLLLLLNIFISNLAIQPLAKLLNGNIAASKIIMQIAVVFWNYLIYNYFIFRNTRVVNER